jgi:regulatory protein
MNSKQQKLLHYSYDLLARRRYSIREMVTRLEARNHKSADPCSDDELKQILEGLVRANLLNDRDYATFYLDAQLRRKPVGPLKIRMHLRSKGIEESVISQVVNAAQLDSLQLARDLLGKKTRLYTAAQLRDQKVQARLLRFLAGNGFSAAAAGRALREAVSASRDSNSLPQL